MWRGNVWIKHERFRISFAIRLVLIYTVTVGIVVREVRMDKVYTIDEINDQGWINGAG